MIERCLRVFSLAHIVILDGIRRNAMLGLLLFACVAELSVFYFFQFIPRGIGQASADFVLSIAFLIGLLFLFFHAVEVVAWDDERRTIQFILARPLSRTDYVVGVFLGLVALLVFLNFFLAGIGAFVLLTIKHLVADIYFSEISWLSYFLSWLGVLSVECMILVLIVAFSSVVRGGFPVLLLTVCYYFICNGLPVVRDAALNNPEIPNFQHFLLKWLTLVFPDFSRFDYKLFITMPELIPPFSHIQVNLLFAMIYVVFFLFISSFIYQQRDLQ